MKRMILLAALTSFTLASSGCGTGIGNAVAGNSHLSAGTGSYEDNPAEMASIRLMKAVCAKIYQCHSPAPAYCDAEILQTNTIDTEIGLSSGTYTNYAAVVAADFSMEITANQTALNSCVSEVRGLDCEFPGVQNAYQAGQVAPFAQVAEIFTPVCAGVF